MKAKQPVKKTPTIRCCGKCGSRTLGQYDGVTVKNRCQSCLDEDLANIFILSEM